MGENDALTLTPFDEPYIDLGYTEDISFDDAVDKAREAMQLKRGLMSALHKSCRAYIAELSTVHAVEHGGVAKFAKQVGLNYSNLRVWRSRYLPSDQKRRYLKAQVVEVATVTIGPETDAPLETPSMFDEAVFVDMFDGRARSVSELEPVEEKAHNKAHNLQPDNEPEPPSFLTAGPIDPGIRKQAVSVLQGIIDRRNLNIRSITVVFDDESYEMLS